MKNASKSDLTASFDRHLLVKTRSNGDARRYKSIFADVLGKLNLSRQILKN